MAFRLTIQFLLVTALQYAFFLIYGCIVGVAYISTINDVFIYNPDMEITEGTAIAVICDPDSSPQYTYILPFWLEQKQEDGTTIRAHACASYYADLSVAKACSDLGYPYQRLERLNMMPLQYCFKCTDADCQDFQMTEELASQVHITTLPTHSGRVRGGNETVPYHDAIFTPQPNFDLTSYEVALTLGAAGAFLTMLGFIGTNINNYLKREEGCCFITPAQPGVDARMADDNLPVYCCTQLSPVLVGVFIFQRLSFVPHQGAVFFSVLFSFYFWFTSLSIYIITWGYGTWALRRTPHFEFSTHYLRVRLPFGKYLWKHPANTLANREWEDYDISVRTLTLCVNLLPQLVIILAHYELYPPRTVFDFVLIVTLIFGTVPTIFYLQGTRQMQGEVIPAEPELYVAEPLKAKPFILSLLSMVLIFGMVFFPIAAVSDSVIRTEWVLTEATVIDQTTVEFDLDACSVHPHNTTVRLWYLDLGENMTGVACASKYAQSLVGEKWDCEHYPYQRLPELEQLPIQFCTLSEDDTAYEYANATFSGRQFYRSSSPSPSPSPSGRQSSGPPEGSPPEGSPPEGSPPEGNPPGGGEGYYDVIFDHPPDPPTTIYWTAASICFGGLFLVSFTITRNFLNRIVTEIDSLVGQTQFQRKPFLFLLWSFYTPVVLSCFVFQYLNLGYYDANVDIYANAIFAFWIIGMNVHLIWIMIDLSRRPSWITRYVPLVGTWLILFVPFRCEQDQFRFYGSFKILRYVFQYVVYIPVFVLLCLFIFHSGHYGALEIVTGLITGFLILFHYLGRELAADPVTSPLLTDHRYVAIN